MIAGQEPEKTTRNCELERSIAAISDDDIYILNPIFRLRNEKDHVILNGGGGAGIYYANRRVGVVAALCNGKNTVLDIAETIKPLVASAQSDTHALISARANVAVIIADLLSKNKDKPIRKGEFPLLSPIINAKDLSKFGKITSVGYKAKDFLPKDSSEICEKPIYPTHSSAPLGLTWHLTAECSTDCRYCYLKRRKSTPLPKARLLSLVKEAHDIGVHVVSATGGDVITYPHLLEFMHALSANSFVSDIISTKSFVSKELAKGLYECSDVIWSVQFSIDSTVPEIADYMVKGKDYCKTILTSIDNVVNSGFRVSAKAVITPYNILTIPKLYRDLKSAGVDVIRLATYSRSGHHHSDDLFNHPESYAWLHKQVDLLKNEFPDDDIHMQNGDPTESVGHASKEQKAKAWPGRSRCSAGRTSMMICADGKVIPCEQMLETEDYFCGDLSNESIQEVWNGPRLRQLTYGIPREKFVGQVCYECEERAECHQRMGYCIRDVANQRKTIYLPPNNCPKVELPFIRTV